MNKKEMITAIAEKMDTTKKASAEILDAVIEVITETLAAGQEVKITGFGTFSVVERPEREGRNPMTGETIRIAASKAPKFKAGKSLKDAVNA